MYESICVGLAECVREDVRIIPGKNTGNSPTLYMCRASGSNYVYIKHKYKPKTRLTDQ